MIKRQKLPEKKLVSPNKAADDPNELGPNKQDSFTFRGLGPSDFVQEMQRRREEVMRRYKITQDLLPKKTENERKEGCIRRQLPKKQPERDVFENRLNRSHSGFYTPSNRRVLRYTTKQNLLSTSFLLN